MFSDRSLETGSFRDHRLIPLEQLADGGHFQNTRQMKVHSWWLSHLRLHRVICSMANLEKLEVCSLTLTEEDLAQLFQSCPKLNELRSRLCFETSIKHKTLEIGEDLKNELRSGFERLRLFDLHNYIGSWPAFQEMFT
jgi:hypothetical protein